MSQEKANSYIKEIDDWLNEMGTLETTISSFDLTNIFNNATPTTTTTTTTTNTADQSSLITKSFSLLSLDEAYNAYANAVATCVDEETEQANANLLKSTTEEIINNSNSLTEQDYNLNLKKENLINSIQYLNTQLLALREMFDKRQDQLKNSRFLISNNNVVSVIKRNGSEPAKQLFNNLDDNDDLEDYDSEFIYEDVHNQHRVAKENLFSDLDLNVDKNDKKIIKRDSMNKVI
jgi:hypothetical protein